MDHDKLERYEKAIRTVIRETFDDDTHAFLNKVLMSNKEVSYYPERFKPTGFQKKYE